MSPVRLLAVAAFLSVAACQQPAPEAETEKATAPETAVDAPLTEDQAAAEAAAAVAATEGQPEAPVAPPGPGAAATPQTSGEAEPVPGT